MCVWRLVQQSLAGPPKRGHVYHCSINYIELPLLLGPLSHSLSPSWPRVGIL